MSRGRAVRKQDESAVCCNLELLLIFDTEGETILALNSTSDSRNVNDLSMLSYVHDTQLGRMFQ